MSNNGWKKISTDIVYQNPWFKVRHDVVIRPDGRRGEFNTVESPASVSIVVLSDKDKIAFVRLFRYSVQQDSWELPGGAIDEGETPIQAAQRELREETGLAADTWHELGTIQTATGFINKPTHGFVVRDVHEVGGDERLEEGITDLQMFTWDEVQAMILDERIMDAPAIATLCKYRFSAFFK